MNYDFGQGLNEEEMRQLDRFAPTKAADFATRMAQGILDLRHQRDELEDMLRHYMPYRRLYLDALQTSISHSECMMSQMLGALIDPDSPISLGLAAKDAQRRTT